MKAFSWLLKDKVLRDYQSEDLVKCLLVKNNLVTYDTGMGKTVLAEGVLRALVNEVPNRRFLFIVMNNQFISTVKEVEASTGLVVETCSGQAEDQYEKLIRGDVRDYQVLFLSYTFFDNLEAVWFLYKHIHLFYGVIIDEAHLASNFTKSSRAFVIRALLRNIEFKLALTATPATTETKQFAELLHVLFPEEIEDVNGYAQQLKSKKIKAHEDLDLQIINRSRPPLIKYKTETHLVECMPGQDKAKGNAASIIIKGPGAENQYQKLKEILQNHVNVERQGLVFIRHLEVMDWVYNRLLEDGFRVDFINSKKKLDEKGKVFADFRSGKIDFMLTSISAALGSECDFLIIYESCPDIIQMLGRGNREMNPKIFHLDFIFTEGTREIDYFLEDTYRRSIELQYVLQKDYNMLINATYKLKEKLKSSSFK